MSSQCLDPKEHDPCISNDLQTVNSGNRHNSDTTVVQVGSLAPQSTMDTLQTPGPESGCGDHVKTTDSESAVGRDGIHDLTTDSSMASRTRYDSATEPSPRPESPDEFWPRYGGWHSGSGYRCNACLFVQGRRCLGSREKQCPYLVHALKIDREKVEGLPLTGSDDDSSDVEVEARPT
ncbi:hypothetical protein BD309DRAFT_773093 [Dichomitus squalens]|uniref:Uncharacterized protein n=1 Tax=Dichomitus squalens TaxID=114155 RepID=A0A4Q9PRB5_9APHY|nr:hypothetical protein BD311DRAFT_777000 [Dichomitus squalens]TBU44718.1 hypothetical protein BD309DRAFT_773093 [Dichomitus squalens]TBU56913.1 hypothetical protein BD310DRAFT_949788 [Dichomitus squalens]